MQLFFFNDYLFLSFEAALGAANGIVALSVFIQVRQQHRKTFYFFLSQSGKVLVKYGHNKISFVTREM